MATVYAAQCLMLGLVMLSAVLLVSAGVLGWASDRGRRCLVYLPAIIIGFALGAAALIAAAKRI